MLRGMSWEDFLGWVAYFQLEPFDEVRADLRAASICTMIANVNRDPKRRAQPFAIKDFLLNFEEQEQKPKKQTWQQQKMIAQFIAAAMTPTPRKKKA